jgi:integrase
MANTPTLTDDELVAFLEANDPFLAAMRQAEAPAPGNTMTESVLIALDWEDFDNAPTKVWQKNA